MPSSRSSRGSSFSSSSSSRGGSGYRGQSRRPSGSSSRPAPVRSDLELALDAAAESAAAETPDSTATFASLGLPQLLVTALERRDLRAPFAIQTKSIPDALSGRDVLGRGATGSGKTLAFGLPLLTRLAQDRGTTGQRVSGAPRGLVLVPTRELAQQVTDALAPLGQALDLKVSPSTAARHGPPDRPAAPRRRHRRRHPRPAAGPHRAARVHARAGAGHRPRRGRPHGRPRLHAGRHRAARHDRRVVPAAAVLRRPSTAASTSWCAPTSRTRPIHAVATAAVARHDDGPPRLRRAADAKVDIAAEIAARPGRTLIFVRTKHGADRLALQLRKAGVESGAIHGNLTQNARKRALENFTTGHARVLVATDVAARGIHVDDVDLVVHYDPPADHKDYLHRSGRTARAGASGTVLSLLLSDQVREHQRLRERAGVAANAITVVPGHPAVRELAESGEPIVLQPRAPYVARSAGARSGGRPRRPGAPSSGRPGAGRSGGRPAASSSAGRPTA
jgi:hypothetical protein